jgi:hypothetical protein
MGIEAPFFFGYEHWSEVFGQGEVVHTPQDLFGLPHTPPCVFGIDLPFVALSGFLHQQLGYLQDLFTLLDQVLTNLVEL